MTIHVLAVPYDSGHRAKRMGKGPQHLLEHGSVPDRLSAAAGVLVHTIEHDLDFPTEIGTAFELHRALARKVAEALSQEAFPLVLSGNCNSSLGTIAGLQRADPGEPVGVIWFDGHGDCNTPETFEGDFLDAMGLSTLTGLCWQSLARSVPGFKPVSEHHVLLIGGHGMDQGAQQVLARSRMAHGSIAEIKAKGVEAALAPHLGTLKKAGIKRVYLHLDVDVIDAEYAPANEFAPEGGLLPTDLARAVEAIAAQFEISATAVASYDPTYDRDDRILDSALEFMELVVRLSHQQAQGTL